MEGCHRPFQHGRPEVEQSGFGGARLSVARGGLVDEDRNGRFPDRSEPFKRAAICPAGDDAGCTRRGIGSAAYVYEVTARSSTFYVTEAFGARLDRWLALHRRHVGQAPDEIRSYGAGRARCRAS